MEVGAHAVTVINKLMAHYWVFCTCVTLLDFNNLEFNLQPNGTVSRLYCSCFGILSAYHPFCWTLQNAHVLVRLRRAYIDLRTHVVVPYGSAYASGRDLKNLGTDLIQKFISRAHKSICGRKRTHTAAPYASGYASGNFNFSTIFNSVLFSFPPLNSCRNEIRKAPIFLWSYKSYFIRQQFTRRKVERSSKNMQASA